MGTGDHREPGGTEPDYRFTLANERTFLAYLRTALALDAGGLVLAQYLHDLGAPGLRRALGVVVVVTGLLTAVAGHRRWRANQRAIRHRAPLPATHVPLALTVAAAVIAVGACLLVVLA